MLLGDNLDIPIKEMESYNFARNKRRRNRANSTSTVDTVANYSRDKKTTYSQITRMNSRDKGQQVNPGSGTEQKYDEIARGPLLSF